MSSLYFYIFYCIFVLCLHDIKERFIYQSPYFVRMCVAEEGLKNFAVF